MAFENISKGEFRRNRTNTALFDKSGYLVVDCDSTKLDSISYNLDFIEFCFDLQQRYDISKLEEAVKLFELLLEENMCSIAADGKINNLLNHIKK